MYQIIYYYRETIDGHRNPMRKFQNKAEFRLRRNALHYVRELVQSEFREKGFGTEEIKNGINCYKSEKTENNGIKIIDITIVVEKEEKVGR